MPDDNNDTLLDGLLSLDPASPEFGKELAKMRSKHKKQASPDYMREYKKIDAGELQNVKHLQKLKVKQKEKSQQAQKIDSSTLLGKMNKWLGTLEASDDKTALCLTALDLDQLADTASELAPSNPDAGRITRDLDKDLTHLKRKKHLPTVAKEALTYGKKQLESFDARAKQQGYRVPERQYKKAKPILRHLTPLPDPSSQLQSPGLK